MNIYYGGPVNTNNLYYIHRLGAVVDDSLEVAEGVYWGGNFETIRSLMFTQSLQKDDIRFFVGYSGWGEGQLETELREKSWVLSREKNLDQLFIEKRLNEIWRKKMTSLGDKYALWANFPETPGMN
jgi:putative transcriptional regulator